MTFTDYPHDVFGRIEYWWDINISRFKRSSEDSEERKTEEEGRDSRELHDDDEI
jgi:hypothetical protein